MVIEEFKLPVQSVSAVLICYTTKHPMHKNVLIIINEIIDRCMFAVVVQLNGWHWICTSAFILLLSSALKSLINSSLPHLLAALHAEGQALTQRPWLTNGFTCFRSNAIPFFMCTVCHFKNNLFLSFYWSIDFCSTILLFFDWEIKPCVIFAFKPHHFLLWWLLWGLDAQSCYSSLCTWSLLLTCWAVCSLFYFNH